MGNYVGHTDDNTPNNAVICSKCKTLFTSDGAMAGMAGWPLDLNRCPVCLHSFDFDEDDYYYEDDEDIDDIIGGYGGINTPRWDAEIGIEPKKKKEKEEKRVRGRLLDLS